MPFPQMKPRQYPRRFWFVRGQPDAGKSTFIATLRQPLLIVDADQRFDEVLRDAPTLRAHALSEIPEDNTDSTRIATLLDENMPGSGIQTIAIDSATAIITPHVTKAIRDKDIGKSKSLGAGFKDKAMVTRQIQDAVTKWGVDNVWIYHIYTAGDQQGHQAQRASLPETELARLVRSSNLQVELFRDPKTKRYGAKVIWARRGRSGMTIWDNAGYWLGMPEMIERAVYDGLSQEEQDRIARTPPASFPDAATAIAWGLEQGAFEALEHARNAYNKLKTTEKPADAKAMRALWVADVQSRLADKAASTPADAKPKASEDGQDGSCVEQDEFQF